MPYLRPSSLLLLILSVLLSVLILSCDPDEAKKKPTTQDQNDNNDNQTNKPPKTIKFTKLTRAKSTIPVVSLDAVRSQTAGNDGGTDANDTVWAFQNKEIIFSTTAKDKDNKEIANAHFKWEWRKRGKEKPSSFGRTWTEITGQTTATATLRIPADERVGAYELKVSATSGGQTEKSAQLYKFTVRKSGCPAPDTKNAPANYTELQGMVTGDSALAEKDIPALDTSLITFTNNIFNSNKSFNSEINCWDVSNITDMQFMFNAASSFNQNIGDWDVSKVTNMNGLFILASNFNNGDSPSIGNWDVSKVKHMTLMFSFSSAFDQNLSRWVVTQITKSASKQNFDFGATAWKKANKPKFP